MMISLCNSWEFTDSWDNDFLSGKKRGTPVRLPHNVREMPLHYALNSHYEMICGYRRTLDITPEMSDKKLFLQFDGAGHIATVFVNGILAGEHRTGYTAFRVDISELVHIGENSVTVKLDCTENGSTPPFGFVIDYLTFGGLYREAWLDVRPETYVEDIFVTTPSLDKVNVKATFSGKPESAEVRLIDPSGEVCGMADITSGEATLSLMNAKVWDNDNPNLYTCAVKVKKGNECDEQKTTFGVRTVEFKADGFYLNGKKSFLRGLNRHQCWPYMGYAAPESLQREDARILKNELQVTAVRTSHYPQSQYFIDECDRLGLCVFTEIPGWQHIGDKKWQDQACENVKEMVMQYRNHPSIVLWGVRINESVDNDEFYKRTNAIAHELDPSRPTSGVRFIEKSSLLEDVYAFNDFSHIGTNDGCRPKSKVTTDMAKGFLISEHSGHMFPTKSFDPWEKRQEHALRHARVLNAALADNEHAGCFGWCMFDYNTHKDFGSGDRICYHGVLDAFRNPKLAAATYASQGEKEPVLEIGSSFDMGDYAGANLGKVWAFTNADEVKLYKNDNYVTSFKAKDWAGLKHGPILIDDIIGELLHTQEGFEGKKESLVRECLVAAWDYGMSNLPLKYKLKLAWCMLRYGLKYEDGVALYSKYIGNWGGEATRWRFDAISGGKVVKSVTKTPGNRLHLEVRPTKTSLTEGDKYDMSSLRIRILDENGNIASFAQIPVSVETEGDIELVGPAVVTAEGGMCGAYVRTVGKSGTGKAVIKAAGLQPVTIDFTIAQ